MDTGGTSASQPCSQDPLAHNNEIPKNLKPLSLWKRVAYKVENLFTREYTLQEDLSNPNASGSKSGNGRYNHNPSAYEQPAVRNDSPSYWERRDVFSEPNVNNEPWIRKSFPERPQDKNVVEKEKDLEKKKRVYNEDQTRPAKSAPQLKPDAPNTFDPDVNPINIDDLWS